MDVLAALHTALYMFRARSMAPWTPHAMHKRPTTRAIEQLAFLDLDTHSPCTVDRGGRSEARGGLVGGRADRPRLHTALYVSSARSMAPWTPRAMHKRPTTRDIDHFFTVLSQSKISASAGDFDIDHSMKKRRHLSPYKLRPRTRHTACRSLGRAIASPSTSGPSQACSRPGCRARSAGTACAANSAASAPPCPSKTPKKLTPAPCWPRGARSGSTVARSSWYARAPIETASPAASVGASDGAPAPAGPARPWLDVPRDAALAGADAGAARAAAVRGRFGPAAPDEPAAASSSSLGARHAVLAEEVGGRGCWLACRPRRRFGLREPVPSVVATTWGRGISSTSGRSLTCFFGRGGAAAAAAPRALPELL